MSERRRVEHYCQGKIEPIDFIHSQFTQEQYEGYLRGNVIKYMARYPHKDGLGDLYKAQTYLEWLIEHWEIRSAQ